MITPYRIIFQISATAILAMLFYLALHLIPFSWFVSIEYVHNNDVCLGSDVQTLYSQREVWYPIKAHVYSQIVKIEGVKVIETTIDRDASYGYEEDGFVDFTIRWSEPFTEVGSYGVNSWIEIYPLPFITVKEFSPYQQALFNVIKCN